MLLGKYYLTNHLRASQSMRAKKHYSLLWYILKIVIPFKDSVSLMRHVVTFQTYEVFQLLWAEMHLYSRVSFNAVIQAASKFS